MAYPLLYVVGKCPALGHYLTSLTELPPVLEDMYYAAWLKNMYVLHCKRFHLLTELLYHTG